MLYELHVGIAKSSSPERRTQQLSELTSIVQILPFSRREAQVAADIRVALERQGRPIGPCDILIAATALAHGAILVSHNLGEFRRIEALRVEYWY